MKTSAEGKKAVVGTGEEEEEETEYVINLIRDRLSLDCDDITLVLLQ